jgi:two-component sensor histidine kinase
MCRDGRDFVLSVRDDGVGMPRHIDYRNAGSFGLQLVDALVSQLEGSIILAGDKGTAYVIRFMDRE